MRSRFPTGLSATLLLAAWLFASAGCGFFSSDSEPLPGVYETDEFRIQTTDGNVIDVGGAGGSFEMTLREDGTVEGRLVVPPIGTGERRVEETFSGTYERSGERVTFDFAGALSTDYFNTGTSLAEVAWMFYEGNARLGASADGYVLFLEKTRSLNGGEG